jgi:rhamnosyltransferase
LNAAQELPVLLAGLREQKEVKAEILVVDSSSSDATQNIAIDNGARLHVVERNLFDHGGTRTEAARLARGDILVFMTQDAVPADSGSISRLISAFDADPRVVAAYGRQLPRADADSFAQHLRLFNYPETSYVRCYEDRHNYGFKTAFISNSFAAYRRKQLEDIGFFGQGHLFGEDTYTLAKLLIKGFCVAYIADACVIHSHNYSVWEDFKRYFDVGVFHKINQGVMERFGPPSAEGRRYVTS